MAGGPVQKFEWDDGQGGQGQMALASTLITLLLLVAIGFGMWQRSDAGDVPATILSVAEDESVSVAEGAAVLSGGLFGGPRSLGIDADVGVADRSSGAPQVFFVASAEAATEVRNRIVEENRLRFANGAPERDAQVIVVESDEQAAEWTGALRDTDAVRTELGAPPFEIIDIRSSGAIDLTVNACSGDGLTTALPTGGMAERHCEHGRAGPESGAASPARAGTRERITVYLVTNLAETGLIYDRYLRPNEMALRVGTTEEEVRADAMLRELTLRVGDGNVTVIDMRAPDASVGEAGVPGPSSP